MASVPGRLAVRDKDVQLRAVAQAGAGRRRDVDAGVLMAAATSASASGGMIGGVLRIRPELHLG